MRMPLLNNFVGHSVTPSKVKGPVVVAIGLNKYRNATAKLCL